MTLQYLGTLDKVERDPEFLPKMEAVPWVDIKLPRHIDVHLEVFKWVSAFWRRVLGHVLAHSLRTSKDQR